MTDTDVEVTFGADTAALTAGVDATKARIAALNAEIVGLSQRMLAAGQAGDSGLTRALKGMQSEVRNLQSIMVAAENQMVNGSTGGHGGGHTIFGMQSSVFLELRALLDEALSGRMRNFEGSFARLMGMVGPSIVEFAQANAALVGFGAAAAAAAAGVLYLGVQEAKTREENEQLMASASAGQFQRTEEQANQLRTAFVTLSGESQSSANDILASFDKLGAGGAQLATALIPYMKALAKAEGDDVGEEAKKLVARFSDLNGAGLKYLESVHSVTEAERQHYVSLVATGQRGQAWEIILRAMESTLGDVAKTTTQMTAAHNSADYALGALSTAAGVEVDMMKVAKDADEATKKATEELTASLNAARGAFGSLADESSVASATLVTNANKVADSYDRIGAAARKISGDSSTLFAGIFQSVKGGDLAEATRLLGALPKVVSDAQVNRQQSADPLGLSRDAIKQAEDDIKQWQATTGASQDEVRAHSAQIWKQMASDSNLSIAQQHDAYQKYLDQVIAGNNAAAKGGAKAAKDELGATEQGIDGQIAEIERQTEYETKHYEVMVKLHQMTEDQKAKATIDALQKEQTAIDALYAKELALGDLSLTKRQEILNKEQAENDKVAEAMYEAQAQAAEKAQKAWDGVTKTINSAIDSQVNGLLKGSENFRTAMKNIAASLIESGIKNELNSLLTGIEGIGGKALGIGGAGAGGQGGGILQAAMSALATALGLNTAATTTHTVATTTGTTAQLTGNAVSGVNTTGILANTVSTDSNTLATQFAGIGKLFSFATGTPYVQQTGIAMIHEGERIVPAHLNTPEGMASLAFAGGSPSFGPASGAGGAGGDVTHNHSWNLSLPNVRHGSDFAKQILENAPAIAAAMNKAISGGHHLGLKNIT